jgi:hypothetical protein
MDIASRMIRERLAAVVSAEDDRDMVSDVDVEIERAVRGYLHEQDPEIGFKGESTALVYGAYSGDTLIRVRLTEELKTAAVTIGDYAMGEQAETRNQARLDATGRLARRALRVRGDPALRSAASRRRHRPVSWGGRGWAQSSPPRAACRRRGPR